MKLALLGLMTAISLCGCKAPFGPVENHAEKIGATMPVMTFPR